MTRTGPVVVGRDGVRLRTRVHGGLGAPVVVLQHGVGSSTRFLEEAVVPPLVDGGWQVVVAPLRGHAGADPVREPGGHDLHLLAADVSALVAATGAAACGGVSIAAHAAVAAVAAGATPGDVRIVAALPAWTGTTSPGVGPHAAVAAEVAATGIDGMWHRLAATDGLRPWLRRVLLRDLAVHDAASLTAALVALDGGRAPSIEDVASIPAGAVVVGWDEDPGHPLEVAHAWATAAPDASLVTISLDDLDEDLTALGRAIASGLGSPLARR